METLPYSYRMGGIYSQLILYSYRFVSPARQPCRATLVRSADDCNLCLERDADGHHVGTAYRKDNAGNLALPLQLVVYNTRDVAQCAGYLYWPLPAVQQLGYYQQ